MVKRKIDCTNREIFKEKIRKEAESKSKVKHWLEMRDNEIPRGREKYTELTTRKQFSI